MTQVGADVVIDFATTDITLLGATLVTVRVILSSFDARLDRTRIDIHALS